MPRLPARGWILLGTALTTVLASPSPAGATAAAKEGDVLRVYAQPGEANVVELTEDSTYIYVNEYSGAPITPAAGCEATQFSNSIRCGRAGIARIVVQLGDLNDEMQLDHPVSLPIEVHGEAGNDQLTPNVPPVSFFGEDGDDRLRMGPGGGLGVGGLGNDGLIGGPSADVLSGGEGNDSLFGGGSKDKLIGLSGNDVFNSRDGVRELVSGGNGQDRGAVDKKDNVVSVEKALAPGGKR